MKYYCMPADFKTETIDEYVKLNKFYNESCVNETYGQITTGNSIKSGRNSSVLPSVDMLEMEEYIKYSKEKNIKFNYTFNPAFMNNMEFTEEGLGEIKVFLEKLYSIGVRSLTVAMPTLMEFIRKMGYDFEIKVSAICQIVNLNMALHYQRYKPERLVVGESINRNFSALRRINKGYHGDIEVIANSMCHINCVNKMFHYNEISGNDYTNSCSKSSYYPTRCILKRYEEPENILKLSWIRPEDIKYYTSIGINHFKMQGRQMISKGNPIKFLERYFEESFDGNLLELLEMFSNKNPYMPYVDNKKLDGFIDSYYKDDFCTKDCEVCGYCKKAALRCMDVESIRTFAQEAKAYYAQADEFRKLIDKVKYK